MVQDRSCRSLLGVLMLALGVAGCSGSSSNKNSSANGGGFQLIEISIPDGEQSWEVNRPIQFEFNRAVMFESVNFNTINIRESGGNPATGSFSYLVRANGSVDESTIVFQPRCPTLPDFSDSGLRPGGVTYIVNVLGEGSGGITVLDQDGDGLVEAQLTQFRTPDSFAADEIFEDGAIGPPQAVLFNRFNPQSDPLRASRAVITGGGLEGCEFTDGDSCIIPFEIGTLDCDGDDAGSRTCTLPLNLFTGTGGTVEVFVVLNQAVDPTEANINSNRVGIEFESSPGVWERVRTIVELTANCTELGGELRLVPDRILPPGRNLRVFLSPDFSDLRGESNGVLADDDFALMRTREGGVASLEPAGISADAIHEPFLLGSSSEGSLENEAAVAELPSASWGATENDPTGALRASFNFAGTGGPGGDFDVLVRSNQELVFDTDRMTLSNSNGGGAQPFAEFEGGLVDVRNFEVQESAIVTVRGSNPLRILASGTVTIRGTIDVSGLDASGVQEVGRADLPQPGGTANAGGGQGGAGSPVTTSSSPRGGRGFGPNGTRGGNGGESGFSGSSDADHLRPGGGGGGAFTIPAAAGFDGYDTSILGLTPPQVGAIGAQSGSIPATGGLGGDGPFLGAGELGFYGLSYNSEGNPIRGLIPSLWGGSGGGGGGDAVPSAAFPHPEFISGETEDHRGGGGGGGGGAVHIRALGNIVFGQFGAILADGGDGGQGESTSFVNRLGGGGGGGSGGHVIIETNGVLDMTEATNTSRVVSAVGGSGAVALADDADLGRPVGGGGDGGPGVVQIHVPGRTAAEQTARILISGGGVTLGTLMVPSPFTCIPTIGSRTQSTSKWLALGGASPQSGSTSAQPKFRFSTQLDNTLNGPMDDPAATGRVITNASGLPISEAPFLTGVLGADAVDTSSRTISVDASPLLGTEAAPNELDIYLRNPGLLEGYSATFDNGTDVRLFTVAGATYDETNETLALGLMASSSDLALFGEGSAFRLREVFFQVNTLNSDGTRVAGIREDANVTIQFQATGANLVTGNPDEGNILVDWTGDWAALNNEMLVDDSAIEFIRFRATFDVDTADAMPELGSALPGILFLKLPFWF